MTFISEIPKEKTLDASAALLKEGYLFAQNRCRTFDSNVVQTRLLGKKAILISGKEAAEVFYDTEKFQRKGAVPGRIQKSLFGVNAIQTMDGAPHEHRKLLFLSLMTPPRLERIIELTRRYWEEAAARWEGMEQVVLFDEAQEVLCRAASEWAGVPLREEDVSATAKDYGDMVEAFGAIGDRHAQGRLARMHMERKIEALIEEIRAGKHDVPEETAAHAMAFHKDHEGQLLPARMAAIELINVVRPIVAIGRYVMFSAIALHRYPEYADKVRGGVGEWRRWFVQEVRRYYPFTPLLGAEVKQSFVWDGYFFKEGATVLLDVYGTLHSPSLWEEPDAFRPERFEDWEGSAFDLIPQGGGDDRKGHRCPGEELTIRVMDASLAFLTGGISYQVPEQDLEIDLSRMPALPESRFVMTAVRRRQEALTT
ncbi:cytochrome P450 [Paenibacillus sp. 1P07SE]|uniref:cytochrome P450 n=1 Tax=Paenibacillus sp. 1P07SE TaxID=3132209 RepID=UPI0039A59242